MKRYIKYYSVVGCIYNESEGYFENVDVGVCVATVEAAADAVLGYLEEDAVDAVFVNGTIEFDSTDYWNRLEIISKILDEEG